jgi:hypothetical protein
MLVMDAFPPWVLSDEVVANTSLNISHSFQHMPVASVVSLPRARLRELGDSSSVILARPKCSHQGVRLNGNVTAKAERGLVVFDGLILLHELSHDVACVVRFRSINQPVLPDVFLNLTVKPKVFLISPAEAGSIAWSVTSFTALAITGSVFMSGVSTIQANLAASAAGVASNAAAALVSSGGSFVGIIMQAVSEMAPIHVLIHKVQLVGLTKSMSDNLGVTYTSFAGGFFWLNLQGKPPTGKVGLLSACSNFRLRTASAPLTSASMSASLSYLPPHSPRPLSQR